MPLSKEQYEQIIDTLIKGLIYYIDEEEWQDNPEKFIEDEGCTAKIAINKSQQLRRQFEQDNIMEKLK